MIHKHAMTDTMSLTTHPCSSRHLKSRVIIIVMIEATMPRIASHRSWSSSLASLSGLMHANSRTMHAQKRPIAGAWIERSSREPTKKGGFTAELCAKGGSGCAPNPPALDNLDRLFVSCLRTVS